MDDQPILPQPRPQVSLITIFVVAASLIIAFALVAMIFIWGDFSRVATTETPPLPSSNPITEPAGVDQTSELALDGVITGSLAYPSEGIPENMKVCAVEQTSQAETCTNEQIKSQEEPYGVSYKIQVPAGTYLVYAQLDDQPPKAYYSEFVTCGLMAECPSHEPIPVEVKPGETVNNVDPHDWYVVTP